MRKIPLIERVPQDYHRLYRFFGEAGFMAFICVDGDQWLYYGETVDGSNRNENLRNCLDWMQEVVQQIRDELQALEKMT